MRSPVAREVRWPVVSGPLDFCGGEVAGEDGKGGGGGGEGEGGKGGGGGGEGGGGGGLALLPKAAKRCNLVHDQLLIVRRSIHPQ